MSNIGIMTFFTKFSVPLSSQTLQVNNCLCILTYISAHIFRNNIGIMIFLSVSTVSTLLKKLALICLLTNKLAGIEALFRDKAGPQNLFEKDYYLMFYTNTYPVSQQPTEIITSCFILPFSKSTFSCIILPHHFDHRK